MTERLFDCRPIRVPTSGADAQAIDGLLLLQKLSWQKHSAKHNDVGVSLGTQQNEEGPISHDPKGCF